MSEVKQIAVLTLLGLVFTGFVLGQGGVAVIEGTITDRTGGAIPGASVTATHTATNTKTVSVTTDVGIFQLRQLRPGPYVVRVEFPGFKSLERTGLELQVGDRIALNLQMEVGEVTENISVTGETPLLRTGDAQTGEVVSSTMIRNLPQLNRDPLQLLVLAGNVQGGGSRATSGSDTRISGGRTVGVEYIVDGITAGTGLGRQVVRTIPTTEAVGEFRVITNGISAEYGRMSGGAVEIISRAGTNRYHGELFEYNQNDAFNANSWQQNTLGGKKAHFTDNIFGGTLGGPVWIPKIYNGRDKTFFFFNYEGNRRREAGTLLEHSVPTELERKGDFSQTFYNGIYPELYDQNGPVTYDEGSKTWYRQDMLGDGKRIPDSRISPVSRALLKWVPLPNQAPRPGTSSTLNYKGERSTQRDNDTWAVRIDHQINESQSLFGRFTTRNNEEGQTRWRGPLSTANQNISLNYDWTLSPTLLLNVRAGGNYNPFKSGNLLEQGLSSTEVPFDSVTRSVLREGFPLIRLTAGVGERFISQAPSESYTASTTYDSSLALTKILTRHTLKLGYQHRRYYDNFNNSAGGTFSFHAGPVHQIAGVDFGFGSDVSAAYSTAAFMVGINNQAGVSGSTTRAMNMNYHSAFLQDDFKMTSRLTLNLGVRWDMETPVTERFDKLYIWDPDAPAPFQINPGYDFKAAVSAVGLDPAKVPTPAWVTNGFLGKTILDHVIGGWEVAGTAVLRSGRPVIINARTPNINNGIRVEWTYASFAPGATTVTDERFQKPSQVFFSTKDARPADAVRRFDPAAVVDAQLFTYGTLPPIFSDIRHPGRINYDLSLMKAFYFTGDHDVFLQFRMEASNVFNYHGYGDYNTTAGTLDYGFITGVRNQERRLQMSARLVF